MELFNVAQTGWAIETDYLFKGSCHCFMYKFDLK